MRRIHVHGDEQIAALLRLPHRFADDPTDMNFSAERLAAISARTWLVSGESDDLYPVELTLELERGIRRCESWIVPGGAHSPIFGPARAEFVERALAFLKD
jgi:pimeloyl-ACP methyl ester carboxylesterase